MADGEGGSHFTRKTRPQVEEGWRRERGEEGEEK
jgi:hypothetical protein